MPPQPKIFQTCPMFFSKNSGKLIFYEKAILSERVFNTLFNFEFAINVIDLFTVKFIEADPRLLMDLGTDAYDEDE